MDDQPVYKVYLMKQTMAAITASPEMRADYLKKHDEFLAQTGGKVLLVCDMVWSNEEYEYFGLEVFPNLQSLIAFHEKLRSLGWFAFFESKSYLGWTVNINGEIEEPKYPPPPAPGEKPIYKLVFYKPKGALYAEMEKVNELVKGQEDMAKEIGREAIFNAYMRMNNEENYCFAIERYPSLKAIAAHYKNLELTNWFKYMTAHSCLGKAISGSLSGMEG